MLWFCRSVLLALQWQRSRSTREEGITQNIVQLQQNEQNHDLFLYKRTLLIIGYVLYRL